MNQILVSMNNNRKCNKHLFLLLTVLYPTRALFQKVKVVPILMASKKGSKNVKKHEIWVMVLFFKKLLDIYVIS